MEKTEKEVNKAIKRHEKELILAQKRIKKLLESNDYLWECEGEKVR
jgi:hypothetical protein